MGLSSTTGAFAAGVLLAESGYRAQIEADIQPFEGILLGVFFITAVSIGVHLLIEFYLRTFTAQTHHRLTAISSDRHDIIQ